MQQKEQEKEQEKATIVRKNSDSIQKIHDMSTSTKSLQRRDSDLRKAVVSKQQIKSIRELSNGLFKKFYKVFIV